MPRLATPTTWTFRDTLAYTAISVATIAFAFLSIICLASSTDLVFDFLRKSFP